MDVWARPSREGVGNGEPWIKARVTPVLVIEMSRKSLGGWRARYSRGWQKDVSAQGDGEPHVLGTAVATFCQKMGQSGKRTKHALSIPNTRHKKRILFLCLFKTT